MRTFLLLFLIGCAPQKSDPTDDFSSLGDLKSDSFSSKMRILGPLDDGETRKVFYTSSPLYRGYTLEGGGPVDLWVRSETGDAVAWLLDDKFRIVHKNDDADSTTYDAHLKGTLPGDRTFYLAMRDYDSQKGWFTVERTAQQPLACAGSGLVATIADECMDDGGANAIGDSLEVYCFKGTARFCLSGEACPWRGHNPKRDDGTTCSHAGLSGDGVDFMTHAWCSQWQGHDWYACSSAGQISFTQVGDGGGGDD
jgi:hypothetical protein